MDYNTKALDNYQFLLSLPIIVELIQKNKKLRKDNKSLKNLIYSIPEFRCKCSNSNTITEPKSNKIAPLRKTVQKSTKTDEKNIKLNVVKTEIIDVSDDDSVVFVEKVKKEITPNIIYVLEEELEEGEIREEEEEEVVEEEAEEEEEVVEEEAEEAEEAEEEEAEEEEAEEEEAEEEEAEEEEVVEEEAEEEEEVVEEEAEEEEEVVEEEEEEEVVEEEEEEEVVEEEAEEEEEVVEEESEEEVFEIEIKGKSYYTTNETNGTIYNIDENEEIGEEIGKFENGKPVFYKK